MLLDSLDGIGKSLAHTHNLHFRATGRIERNRVSEDKFFQVAIHDSLARFAGHYAMTNDGADGLSSTFFHHSSSSTKRSGSIGDIVNDNHILAIDIT